MDATIKNRALRDEIYRVSDCIQAVTDLMVPEPDLHVVDRGKLSILLAFLNEKLIDLLNKAD